MHRLLLPNWPEIPDVHAFTTLRQSAGVSPPPYDSFNLGNRCGDDPNTVAANRAELVNRFNLPSTPHWLWQVHGTNVEYVKQPITPQSQEPQADAAVTSLKGQVLAVLTADCLPVIFAATDGSEIAVAHAGWRGLAAGVLENTIAAMHTPATHLQVWLGPAAGPDAYEIGEEVYNAFTIQDHHAKTAFIATRPSHWRVNLYQLALQRLLNSGITSRAVHGGGYCTITEKSQFYSHRRDKCTGRIATILWVT